MTPKTASLFHKYSEPNPNRTVRFLIFWNFETLAKSGLILDGFIGEIGKRQKSFDVRQKFF